MEQQIRNERKLKGKGRNEGSFFVKFITTLLFLALSAYLVVQTARSIDITGQKLDIFKKAQKEVTDLRIKNVKLILMSERVVTEEYIEEEARNRLNYAKDGEILFIIPAELIESDELSEYIERYSYGYVDEGASKKDNLTIWIDFFKEGI